MFRTLTLIGACLLTTASAPADIMFSLVPVGPTTVVQGTSVTIQLIANDPDAVESGTPDFRWRVFSALVRASTADPNDALQASLLAGFGINTSNTDNFDGPGRVIQGTAFPFVPFANGDVLASFTYVADVLGDTVFEFDQVTDLAQFPLAVMGTGDGVIGAGPGITFDVNNGLTLAGTTITVTAVPEPSTFALLGMVGVGLCVARCRRRKQAETV